MTSIKLTQYWLLGAAIFLLALTGSTDAMAQVAGRDDYVVHFSNDALVILTIDGTDHPASITGGSATFQKQNRDCVPAFGAPCDYVANTFQIESDGFSFTDQGISGIVKDVVLGMLHPMNIQDDGSGLGLPPQFDSFVAFDVTISNKESRLITRKPSPNGAGVILDEASGTAAVIATFTGSVDGVDIEYFISGQGTITNQPPLASATATVIDSGDSCSSYSKVTLDASSSTDTEGNINYARWLDSNGVEVGQGLTTTLSFSPGTYTRTVEVYDVFGGLDSSDVTFTVGGDTTAPIFKWVEPDINTSVCMSISLETPAVEEECGSITLTNDAPAADEFPVGTTTVTWTAVDQAGNSSTATQKVTVALSADATCCPFGYNLIEGTSNNDSLVGTDGPDCIFAYGGQDTIDGRGGADLIRAGDGDDIVSGGDGADAISGGSGQDQLHGGPGDDQIAGDDGDDQLFGDDGNDFLDGGANHNQCTGGDGQDTIIECNALDQVENPGPANYTGDPSYNVCDCSPNKCNDCSSGVSLCEATEGCSAIIECVNDTSNCNLPHECSQVCEAGRSQAAIDAARSLASCFGGC